MTIVLERKTNVCCICSSSDLNVEVRRVDKAGGLATWAVMTLEK